MKNQGIKTDHADSDADFKISTLACMSDIDTPTAVVAEDTYVLLPLMQWESENLKYPNIKGMGDAFKTL